MLFCTVWLINLNDNTMPIKIFTLLNVFPSCQQNFFFFNKNFENQQHFHVKVKTDFEWNIVNLKVESVCINTNNTSGQFLEEALLAAEAAPSLWGKVSTRMEYLKPCGAPLRSGMKSAFQSQPQTPDGIPISAVSLWVCEFWGQAAAGRFKQPPPFWTRIRLNSVGHLTLKSHLPTLGKSDLPGGFRSFIYLFVGGFCEKSWPWFHVSKYQEEKGWKRCEYVWQPLWGQSDVATLPS